MKCTWALLPLLLAAAVFAEEEEEEGLKLAEACVPEECNLPSCRCSSTDIPGGLLPRNTPQFVTVTFDDAVNVINIETYRSVLYNRKNKNNCPAGATFYVNHEYTNYQLVNELYNQGFEIALHSITHQTPQTFWAEASVEDIRREFGDQRAQMAHFANIPINAIQGIRSPFLQMSGNATFQVLKEYGMSYDCSWATISHTNPGLWPYSLDFASIQDCMIPPCPSASIPDVWVQPMVSWQDLGGLPCAMADACFYTPDLADEDAWFKFIVTNFERHYLGNRAPFGFYVHEWYIRSYPAVGNAFRRFLDMINNLHDVFMVNSIEVLNWVKDPVPVDEYRRRACRTNQPSSCAPTVCPLIAAHNNLEYWMSICTACPRVYPWVGNPLGQ